jgi:hypothetical protein
LAPTTSFPQKQQNQLNELDNYNPELVSEQTCGRYNYSKDVWMLDTGSTIAATVANPNLVMNIRVSKQPLTMATNAGTKIFKYEADIEGFGTVMHDEEQLANILRFAHIAKKCSTPFSAAILEYRLVLREMSHGTQNVPRLRMSRESECPNDLLTSGPSKGTTPATHTLNTHGPITLAINQCASPSQMYYIR